jgi:Arc/MetJ-type ribon-helix-helix transcriptional regulator
MRQIINISLPDTLIKEVKKEVKKGGYASTSEFIRDALRAWKRQKLAEELHKDKKAFISGKGKILASLADL